MKIENIDAYIKGQDACRKSDNDMKIKNPYKKNTPEWYSWNQGWNSYFNE